MTKLARRISPFALFMLSMNSIIGSGWLFAPLYAAKVAGAAAIVSWIIGGAAAIIIAFTFAELAAFLPVAGGTARIPQLSHGILVSFILSWIAWISTLLLAPVEVQAVIQYASLFFPSLMINHAGTHTLTGLGLFWAAMLMLLLSIINIYSYKGLARFNFALFIFKIFVIVVTIFTFMQVKFHPANFASMVPDMQTSAGWQGILTAVAASGIAFAFNGFKSGVEMAGEAKKLSLAIPLSTVGAVLACLLLYLGLQICFIGALNPSDLNNGWQQLAFHGDVGPFAGLAAAIGMAWLVKLLYVDAIMSPSGAGLIYTASSARILYAMSKLGYMPKKLMQLNHQRFPMYAIMVNYVIGMFSFLPLPGWQAMVSFLVSVLVITYAMGPIALLSLRHAMPHAKRPFKLPMANFFCLLAFYCCNLFSYWTGWENISKLAMVLLLGICIFALAYWRGKIKTKSREISCGLWMIPYLVGLVLISYFGAFGGTAHIPFGWDFLVIAIFSASILYLAVNSRMLITKSEIENFLLSEDIIVEASTGT